MAKKMNSVIILAGGNGSRMKSEIPKQFLLLKNKQILEYSIDTFLKNDNIYEIILVCNKYWRYKVNNLSKKIKIILGGNTRTKSVYNGLQNCHKDCRNIVIHDAARPFIANQLINKGLSYLKKYDAAVPILEINDSIIKIEPPIKYLNRKMIKIIQTPQFFVYKKIFDAYNNNTGNFMDDLSLILNYNNNTSFKLFVGDNYNFKITSKDDYKIAQKIVASNL